MKTLAITYFILVIGIGIWAGTKVDFKSLKQDCKNNPTICD